jgi:hypothetical protein
LIKNGHFSCANREGTTGFCLIFRPKKGSFLGSFLAPILEGGPKFPVLGPISLTRSSEKALKRVQKRPFWDFSLPDRPVLTVNGTLVKIHLSWLGTFCQKRPFSTFALFGTWSFLGSVFGGQKRAVFNVFFEFRKRAIFRPFRA